MSNDAHVVILEVLCTTEQRAGLVAQATAALQALGDGAEAEVGRWVTTGIRLREPRDDAERDWLIEV